MLGEAPSLNNAFKYMPNVGELDFKSGESVAEETGQTETTELKEEATEAPEAVKPEATEDVETLKDRLAKAEEEKENYKKGMFKYKSLKKEEKKEEEIEYPEWDDTSKQFQKQTLSQAEKIAEKKTREIIESNNEKTAITQFVQKHPEMAKEGNWQELVANYNSNHSKDSVESYAKALEKAFVLTRYDRGELDKIETDAEEKGVRKGKAEAQLADMSSVSKTTSKTIKGGSSVSKFALELGGHLRNTPEELASAQDVTPAGVEIKF